MVGLTTRNEASGEQAGSDVRQQLGQRKESGTKKMAETGGLGLLFFNFCTQFSLCPGHEIQFYL